MNTKIQINDLEFDALISGNKENELVIFLHGFPETSYMWKDLIEEIAEQGFYCVAPTMRGYSKNACPKGKKYYRMNYLIQDVLDIADWTGKERFHLVGHDWGAVIGWNAVYHNNNRIISWTALSVPHTRGFAKAIKTDEDQKKKSGYIKMFMIPFLPEMKIRKNDFETFRKLWRNSSEEEIENYLSVFRNKKCLTAALNYYRANFGTKRPEPIGEITTPTLFIWGEKEKYIGKTAANNNADYMKGYNKFLKLNGGHWLIQTNYDEVKTAISEHLSNNRLG